MVRKVELEKSNVVKEKKDLLKDVELCDVCGGIIGDTCTCNDKNSTNEDAEEKDAIEEAFKNMENRPSDEEIEVLKAQYKKLYFTLIDDSKVFIYRAINSGEWAKIMAMKNITDNKREELIVKQCIVWPDIVTFVSEDAGVVPSLYQMILMVSKFLSTEQLLMVTREL